MIFCYVAPCMKKHLNSQETNSFICPPFIVLNFCGPPLTENSVGFNFLKSEMQKVCIFINETVDILVTRYTV